MKNKKEKRKKISKTKYIIPKVVESFTEEELVKRGNVSSTYAVWNNVAP